MDKYKDIRDEDTKKILAEMESEGIDTLKLIPEDERPQPVAEPKEEPKADPFEDKDDDDSDEPAKPTGESDEEEETVDDDVDEDDSDDEPTDVVPKAKYDKVLGMLNKWKKKANRLADAGETTEQVDEEAEKKIKDFAEKNEIPEETLKGILGLVKETAIPDRLTPALDKLLKKQEREDEEERQNTLYKQEYSSTVLPLLKRDFENANPEEIKSVQRKLKALAFDEENIGKSLVQIYLENNFSPKKKIISGEESNGGRISDTPKSLDEIEPEDIAEMSPEEFDRYSSALGKKSTYKIKRR